MITAARRAVTAQGPGLAVGLVLGLLALGPGLRRGFLLSYDMVFVPREPFTSAMFGLSGGAPRAVPSDFVVAVASRLLPADIVQKLILLLIFVLACSGAAALLDREPVLARLAAAVFYGWNPYVAERLIIGQWALLLGYAGLPWVLRAVLRLDDGSKDGDKRAQARRPGPAGPGAAARRRRRLRRHGHHRAHSHTRGRMHEEAQDHGRGAGRPLRRQPALAHPVHAEHRVRRPGRRNRVRGAGRHPVRLPRQPGHAGRVVERDHGAQGLRRALVRHLAGARAGRHRRLRAARRPAPSLAGARDAARSRAW